MRLVNIEIVKCDIFKNEMNYKDKKRYSEDSILIENVVKSNNPESNVFVLEQD